MSKNTVIKIVSIVACALLVAGIVLLVYFLPRGNNEPEEPTLPIRDEEVVEWGEVPVFSTITGNGTEEAPYQISSETDFQTLAEFFNNNHEASNGYYEITNDITLQNFIPIGGFGDETSFFSGNFNANGKTITIANFDESCKGAKNLGIFAKVKNANIENLTIEGTIISGTKNTGGLAGEAGTINVDSCIFNGKMICAGECTGGIIGAITSGEKSTISNCQNRGEFQDDPTNTNPIGIALGGIVGLDLVGDDYTDDSNTEDISSASYGRLGGITGGMTNVSYSGTINRCWNSGNITNTYTSSDQNHAGGICGWVNTDNDTFKNCYNIGYIKASSTGNSCVCVGGICGEHGLFINCYNAGTIYGNHKSKEYVGGICPYGGNYTNCYNIGSISAGTDRYAVGPSNINYCYYLSSCGAGGSGTSFSDKNSISGGYTSGTDTLLNKLNAWQAANTSYSSWGMDNVNGYPTLSAMAKIITLNANGGTVSPNTLYLAPSTATYGTLPTPTRTGYTFANWWTSASGGTQVTASTTATASTEIYAHWTANTYTITLDNQSATSAGTSSIYEKYATGYYKESACTTQMTTSANGILVPERTNYVFRGYFTATNGGGTKYIDANGKLTSSASNTNFTANGTLYANWICLITLDNQSATTAGTASFYEWKEHGFYSDLNCSSKITSITVPSRTSCFFRGYYTAELGGGTQCINASGNITATNTYFDKNTTLYAKWDYTITLDGQLPTTAGTTKIYESYNGGYYLNSDCTTKMSTTANKIDIPTKAGELFGGYFTETNGNGTQYIDRRGFLTTGASTTNFTAVGSLYAYWIHLAGGLGTEINPYLISTAEHLYNLANHVDDGNSCAGQYFKVTADIGTNSSPISWTLPIGTTAEKSFAGSFDGNNHKITYNYNSSTYQYAGLFGYYTGSTIQNLGVGGTLNNTKTDGYAGGVVGYAKTALTLTNSYNTGTVNALIYSGGLVGYSDATITISNSHNMGSVNASSYAGGLLGYSKEIISITNSYNTASVNSTEYTGGLLGYANSITTITNSYNTGVVTTSTPTNDPVYAGGIISFTNKGSTFINCYNGGNITASSKSFTDQYCGGITALGGATVDCYYIESQVHGATNSLGVPLNGESQIGYLLEKLNGYVISNASAGYKYWKVIAGQNEEYPVFTDTLVNYTVTFNVNDGMGGPAQSTYTHYSVFDVPDVAPMKDGCSFVCWNDQLNGKGINYYPNHSYILTSNKTLYAVYVESGGGGDVTIQLCANGGEFVNAQEQTIKSRDVGGIVTLERPTRNGFRFLGYNTKADGSGTDITTMKVSEDISLFAQWEPMEYYVKYYDGSTLLKTDTIPANQQKALSSWTAMKTGQTTAEANGWTFHGWATSNSSFERAYENLAIIENITTFGETINLYAIYSKVLTVNYDGNEATSGSVEEDKSQTVYLSASRTMSNYSVTLKANEFARTNYHFSKWAFGSDKGTQFDVGDSFTQANSSLSWNNDSTFTKTFYAVWEGNGYTINYYNGTTKAGTENYIYGENSTLKTFASLNQTIINQLYGWKFSGWAIANNSITKTFNDGANITNIDIGGSEITQNKVIDLYAIYERTIAFHSGKNCATNSTATQTWNPYNTNASNISSVEAPVPTSLQSENWITLGYRTDQSAGQATYAVTSTTNITPAVNTLCDLYAVYSKEVIITLADKTTTTTTYYNTSGDQTEITTIS